MLKSSPVSSGRRAVGHTSLDSFEKVTNNLKSINNVGSSTLFEVRDSSLSISKDVFDVIEAFKDISESLSVESTFENTFDNFLDLDHIKLDFVFRFLESVMFVVVVFFVLVFFVVWSVVWSVVLLLGFPLDLIKLLEI